MTDCEFTKNKKHREKLDLLPFLELISEIILHIITRSCFCYRFNKVYFEKKKVSWTLETRLVCYYRKAAVNRAVKND